MSFWSKSLSVLLAAGRHSVKRQVTTAPATCQKYCDGAVVAGGYTGFVPALCAANGTFEQALQGCTACIQSALPNVIEVVLNVSNLNQFINYCDQSAPFASAQLIVSSVLSQEAALSSSSVALASEQASLDSVLGITPSSSTPRTTAGYASSSTSPATRTSSPTPPPIPKSNTSTIIGAAVGGSLGGILLLAFIAGFILMRRRKQRKAAAAAAAQPPEKAQLHSDDYKPPREELLGTLGKKQYDHSKMSELPSNEPVEKTKELPANEEVGAELDNKVRIPKTEGSSQSTKVGSGPDG